MNNPFDKFLSKEDIEASLFVKYMRAKHPTILLIHIPNEGRKSAFERYKYSLMGCLTGAPDYFLPIKRGNYSGLWIELKAPAHHRVVKKGKEAGKVVKVAEGKPSSEQVGVISQLNQDGYLAVVCVGAESAINQVEKYFKI